MSWGGGVMKMGNIAPRAKFEPTLLAFQASVLSIKPHRLPDVITLSTPTVAPCLRDQYRKLQYVKLLETIC